MAIRDVRSQRMFVNTALATGATIECSPEQANYLRAVMRMEAGSAILVFNGRDGEWRAELRPLGKRAANLAIAEQVRPQPASPDLWYVFAPLKRSRLDYMVQKAVEMGASRLVPVLTQHTIAERVNTERMVANAIEAAEQCGVLTLAEVAAPIKLTALLSSWPSDRKLIFCDEGATCANPITTLATLAPGPLGVLVGPEGGFSDHERATISRLPFAHALRLGPRIMRADTAAVAALAIVNAVLGDWTER